MMEFSNELNNIKFLNKCLVFVIFFYKIIFVLVFI
jgi:hypothetical protein